MPIRTVKKFIKKWDDEIFKNEVERSITIEIIIEFIKVPTPGFCLSGIQINKTIKLIKKVAPPIEKFNFLDTPSARTTHGAFPIFE
tara:strand:+ start:80 stop:337 length:258 start_codon:yes stop_codon:yes gene_type:complete